jgi:N-acetylneuraminic acid mutarotase
MITYPTKQIGDPWTAVNANEVKTVVNSLFTGYINYFDFSSQSVTTVAQSNTWYKLNTTTTEGFKRNGLVHSNNRVTYIGSETKVFKLEGIASLASNNGNKVHIAFFKNEELWPCSESDIVTAGAGAFINVANQCLIQLAQNDFIEVWVKNATGANNITMDKLNVIVTQL